VVEVLKQLDVFPSDPAAAAAIQSLLGETDRATSAEEIAWAFRKLLEEQAPLIVVFDDIQWGEETFIDLLEGVALLSSAATILLVCIARPELLSRRVEWPAVLRLEPLSEEAADELIGDLPAALRSRVAAAAGGNPLFLTEMRAMAEQDATVEVPPTLRALLAARLDQLDPAERRVLEGGAVEGELFHRGAVQILAPDELQITPRLAALVRRELIRPDRAQLPGEDGFRFRHILIRDAAYDALPKSTRAELHARFADWLEGRGPDLVELDEIVGYHLEQAALYKAELGQPDPGLAERAGLRLADAGRRALARADFRAAAPLLERALELTRPLRLDVSLEFDLADSRQVPREQAMIAERVGERAREDGDRVGEALALVVAARARLSLGDDPAAGELERLARAALPLLEHAEDHTGLGRVWSALGDVANFRSRYEEWTQASERAIHYFAVAGRHPLGLADVPFGLVHGPRPADEALRTLDSALPENPHPAALLERAWLLAMLGRLDEAWALARPAAERAHELGGLTFGGQGDWQLGEIAGLAGDHATATGHLRREFDRQERTGARALLSTTAPKLGRFLCALGRYDEAEPLAQLGRELGDEQDLITQMLWRQVQARVYAHRGENAEAERLAREAETIAERTDGLNLQGDALCDLAEVLATAGRFEAAAQALKQALERYERKKNLAMIAQVRPRLEALRERMPA
jgi:tetratricopeptide (TPR) repeat protein